MDRLTRVTRGQMTGLSSDPMTLEFHLPDLAVELFDKALFIAKARA